MRRASRHKYAYHTYDDEKYQTEREPYNLEDDVAESVNLAAVPEHEERIRAMHEELVRELGEDPEKTERRCRADYARGYSR